jgi:hypothetical protein
LLSSSTNAIGDKEGGLSAAISYTDFNSTGKTEVGTGIVTKSGSITILGTDTVKDNTIIYNHWLQARPVMAYIIALWMMLFWVIRIV